MGMYQPKFEEMTTLPAPVGYQPRADLLVPMVSKAQEPPKVTATPEALEPKNGKKATGHKRQYDAAWQAVEGQVLAALAKHSGPHGATYVRPVRICSELSPTRTLDQVEAACRSLARKGLAIKKGNSYRHAMMRTKGEKS